MDQQQNIKIWAEAAKSIDWFKEPSITLDDSQAPLYQWFSDGECNTCYNSLDRHVQNNRGDQTAIIYDSPVTNTIEHISYSTLLHRVSRFAGALKELGVCKGDRVVIYMPMVPEAAVAMQACARIGAIHSVVFGGFAANELASRIDDCQPKLILSASCGIEPGRLVPYKPLLDEAINRAMHKPEHCIILQRPELQVTMLAGRDLNWHDVEKGGDPCDCEPLKSTDPLYIIYTSGTTGNPKGVVRDNGGHMVAMNWSLENVYGINPGDVFWAASDIGWVVGHSYIVYGPLIRGATAIMFEGKPVGTPDAATYWRLIERHKVKAMFTAPTAIRAIKQQDPAGEGPQNFDLSSLKHLFLGGERADSDTIQWAERQLGIPVIDHWWQTELGWPAVANCIGIELLPVKYGSSGKPVPGFDVVVLAEDGRESESGKMGALAIRLPLPPGTLPSLWKNDQGFIDKYLSEYPGYYSAGDAGYIDCDGYVYIMSRTDDVINVAGHRLSTGQMEEVISKHPDVAECAVFGIKDEMKGQIPLGLLVLNSGTLRADNDIVAEVVSKVRDEIGPVAFFKRAIVVKRLPKTRSGKILRATLQRIADKEEFNVPATIDDPIILDEIALLIG
ncbi:propionyl-CoA synthetase [Spongiibacter sp. IMCC21906]|uniref:propionyl-CoA synthetase n=1 Tax=Spongiibacter sp. IMCC21906 TaxID=1620392 RepID=UPI00062DEB72|nr:propionyl-CoA synthetase [Spongiibacter sp. IMCC21906]AKH68081.1 propionyl-CoA synthetase [Spongiibacter sp. IMCC21906]